MPAILHRVRRNADFDPEGKPTEVFGSLPIYECDSGEDLHPLAGGHDPSESLLRFIAGPGDGVLDKLRGVSQFQLYFDLVAVGRIFLISAELIFRDPGTPSIGQGPRFGRPSIGL